MKPHILPVSIPNGSPSYSPIINAAPDKAASLAASAAMLIGSERDLGAAITRILMPPSPEEDKKNEGRPLIPRTSSYMEAASSNSYQQQKRRRRVVSDNSLLTLEDGGGGRSLRQDAGRDASDTYTVTRLGFKLLRYIGLGFRWITRFLALGCYSFLLFPGFLQVGYYYFVSDRVRRGVVYGDLRRNRLDLYLPKKSDGPKPVIAFVTGGAWIIGYRHGVLF